MSNYDIIIIGGGIVGATAAIALAKNTSLKIALVDSKNLSSLWEKNKYDHRVSAISLASQIIFQKLCVWEKILKKRISPYTKMHVWEETNKSKINFDCSDVAESCLGYIIEDEVIRSSLYEAFSDYENLDVFSSIKLISLKENSDCIEIESENQKIFSGKLVIAADGAQSWARNQAQIKLKTHDYNHTAIVSTVKTQLPHEKIARQIFLKTGPLAFLPLLDSQSCSIVWSTLPEHANELLSLNDENFRKRLEDAFSNTLGEVTEIDSRYSFALHMRHAEHYVKPHFALIGDAAHTIHPMAGQGVNLGLLDAAALVEVISDAVTKNRDFSSFATLRRYERSRKSDNLMMLSTLDLLKYLFMTDKKSISSIRNAGMNFADKTNLIKNFLTNYALGKRHDLPNLTRVFHHETS